MRRAGIFLCGILTAAMVTGCGAAMPDLTQEERDLISEYAVGVLLKYDKNYNNRLVDTQEYDTAQEETDQDASAETEEAPEADQTGQEASANDTEVIDVSEDETAEMPSTIEEYYAIPNVAFQYSGYELTQSYPETAEGEELYFAMDATEGTQLLVLRFTAANVSSEDITLNMPEYGARFRISVNGGESKSALSTMLLNDMQMYDDVIPAGSAVELVSIIEVPQTETVDTIDLILHGKDENCTIKLQ